MFSQRRRVIIQTYNSNNASLAISSLIYKLIIVNSNLYAKSTRPYVEQITIMINGHANLTTYTLRSLL